MLMLSLLQRCDFNKINEASADFDDILSWFQSRYKVPPIYSEAHNLLKILPLSLDLSSVVLKSLIDSVHGLDYLRYYVGSNNVASREHLQTSTTPNG